jgi:chaperonin cofactor prefoldin
MRQIIMVDSTTPLTAMANIQASLKLMIQNDQERMDANLKEMKEELMARLEAKIEAEIKTNNEKFEIIHSTLVSLVNIHLDRTEAIQEEIIAQVDTHQERMEVSVNAWRKEIMACQEAMAACLEMMKANTFAVRKEMKACPEKAGACLENKEPTSDEI